MNFNEVIPSFYPNYSYICIINISTLELWKINL
nr:MAG TPA: hypothetical protein [Caudoviricetes sp.]